MTVFDMFDDLPPVDPPWWLPVACAVAWPVAIVCSAVAGITGRTARFVARSVSRIGG